MLSSDYVEARMTKSRAPSQKARQSVFVAYSYSLYPGPDYRAVFSRVGHAHDVEFVFADTRISNQQILDKIGEMIADADFSVFDISDWNPNVTLELGIAKGSGRPWYILIDPSKSTGGIHEAPADLRGFDRVQYGDFAELERGLRKLVTQRAPTRTVSQARSVERETILCNEIVEVEAGRHREVHGDLVKGTGLSVLAREVDGYPFDLYVMDRKNYVRFCRDRTDNDTVAKIGDSIVEFRKRIPRDGIWYVVLDAYRKTADRDIALEIRAHAPMT